MLKKLMWLSFTFLLANSSVYAWLPDFTKMVKQYGDAVVNISTTQKAPDLTKEFKGHQMPEGVPPQMEELFKYFFKGPDRNFQPRDSKSLGSGFIISEDGYLLTNHHVINNADEIIVKLKDRRQLVATVIGSDKRTDIALLKVEATDLPIVKIGSTKQLQVGEWVLAIGSPFGFEQSVTAGIVSAKGRSLPGGNYVPFIQTDVAINPGNSGGPLFNMEGEVIGVNSQIYSRSGGYMGLSFAIPMNVVTNVVEQIKTKGSVSRGWLGVQIQNVTRELAQSFNMNKPHGALVSSVISDGPSEKAGLQIGDVIIEFDGHKIDTSGELPPVIGITPIGKKVKVKIIRAGKKKTVEVVIGLLPEEAALAKAKESKKEHNRLGVTVLDPTDVQRKQLDVLEHGVLVQVVEKGPAFEGGIQQGDVILRIQNNIVRDVTDFDRIVKELPSGQSIAILIQRKGSPIFLALKIDK